MRRELIGLMVATAVMSGCARSPELLKMTSVNVRSDVFQETFSEEAIPEGYSKLTISTSLKTHKPGSRLFDSSKRDTSEYVLLINIDGQIARIEGVLSDDNSRTNNDPEAGDRIRYLFKKKILLKPGSHRLIIASQEDGIAIEKEIILADGMNNIIQLKPQYGGVESSRKPAVYGSGPSFQNGIKGFDVWLNNILL
jgi:hypothetical protein